MTDIKWINYSWWAVPPKLSFKDRRKIKKLIRKNKISTPSGRVDLPYFDSKGNPILIHYCKCKKCKWGDLK